MKRFFQVVVVTIVFLLGISFTANLWADSADNAPTALLKSLAAQMIAGLKENQATLKTHPQLVYTLAERIVVPHADLDEMSKRVLPAATWMGATRAERAHFQSVFAKTLIRTYASALAEYKDETVQFYPLRGGIQGSTVQVDSQIIRTDGPSIAVSYRLIQRGGKWRLYDMIVEGVSMLESFRSQFADKLSRENMSALSNDIAAHNAESSGNS